MHLKLLKFFFEKSAEASGHLISIKITEKSTKDSKKIPKTFQKQFLAKQKYLEKDVYLQKKDNRLLMNLD